MTRRFVYFLGDDGIVDPVLCTEKDGYVVTPSGAEIPESVIDRDGVHYSTFQKALFARDRRANENRKR